MKCRTILHSLILIQGLCNIGAYVNLTVIDGLLEKGVFECNTPVIFTCRVTPNSLIVQWSVGKPIGPFSDSDCLGNICANSSKFPGRYHYTYNQSTGISYLNILNATFDDDQMIYQCTSGSETDSYRAPIVKAPPKDNTTVVNVDDITPNGVTAKMSTGCIYPLQDLSLLWYSTLVNGSGFQNYSVNLKSVACPPTSACARANTSVEGVLRINTTRSGQERIFYVNISFGSVYISRFIGKYNVNEDKTETTIYSTVTLTPTPTNVITSTTTSVITPTQTIVISPTPTIVVSPTSTIVVASQSTDKPSSSTKQNFSSTERYKSVIIASSTGGVVVLIIIISGCVCYKKRKIRNKMKARKHTFSKEDTNVQEIKL